MHCLPRKSSQKPVFDQPGTSSPGHWFSLLSSLAHSPLGVLGIRLQEHILALFVDVNTHGMRGEPDRVCAHLWVLQGITDHTAFAAFAPLNDWGWVGTSWFSLVQPSPTLQRPAFLSCPVSQSGPRPEWPQALAGPVYCTQMVLSWPWMLQ